MLDRIRAARRWRLSLLAQFLLFTGAVAGYVILLGLLLQRDGQIRLRGWVFAGVAVAAVLLVGFLYVRSLTGRIRQVVRGMEQIRQGKYPRLPALGADEVAELVRGFNDTVEELRNRDEKLKSWSAKRETEFVRLSQTLEHERERLGTVLDSIGEGVVVLDAENRVLMANSRVGEIFGVSAGTLIGADLHTLIEQVGHRLATPRLVEEKLREIQRNPGLIDEITLELEEPAGQAIRLFSTPIRGADGKILGRITTSMDLSRQREFDRLREELLSALSHELRNPLTSIKGALGLIQGGAVGAILPEMRELLDVATTNTDRLIQVTRDILEAFELERRQGRMRLGRMLLARALKRATQAVAGWAEQRKVSLETELPENVPAVVGDPNRIAQVLVNLLSNAIRCSAPGQKVVVSAERQGGMVVVSVQDFGHSLSQEVLDRALDSKENEHRSVTLENREMNLRMTICRHIVEAHGGRIWAENKSGHGSTVSFSLPLSQPGEAFGPAGGEIEAGSTGSARLILVADGDEAAARVISFMFESQGHRVILSHSGRQAIELARERRPDMLTLDQAMPDMDGYAVLRTLRSARETRDIPIVFISAQGDSGPAMSYGANFYLEKPIDIDQLRAAAEQALGTH